MDCLWELAKASILEAWHTGKAVVTSVMLDSNVGPGCHNHSIWGDGALGWASEKNFVAIPFAW